MLNGKLEQTIAGKTETLSADEPARAAFYATGRTRIYDEEPAAVLGFTGSIPDGWREYVTQDRDEIEAMAKASFEQELSQYLENYRED